MIPNSKPLIREQDIQAVVRTLRSGNLSGRTTTVELLEEVFSEMFHVKHSIAVNSGTSALFLTMKAMGIGHGDEVIVPDYAFIAVANAVTHTGATPVLAEVEDDYNISARTIKPLITAKTKAIIAVHTYGKPCDMEELLELDIPIIEDCAEAHGAKVKKKSVGSFGIAGCFSFFANKTITCGEGGMITTNDDDLAEEIRLLKDQYRGTERFRHDGVGYGLSLSALQASFLLSQLYDLEGFVNHKRAIAFYYHKKLSKILEIPEEQKDTVHSYWAYPVKMEMPLTDVFEVRPGFFPIHLQKPYYDSKKRIKNSRKLYQNTVCLPSYIGITQKEQDEVCAEVQFHLTGYRKMV